MGVRNPEIATSFGALDSLAVANGRASDAQILRTIARSANRLATRSQPLAQFAFNSAPNELGVANIANDGDPAYPANYGHKGRATPIWQQIVPGPIHLRKKPLHNFAALFAEFLVVPNGGTTYLQVATDGSPFDEAATTTNAPNVVELPEFAGVALEDIPMRPGVDEHVTYYIRGTPGDDASDQGTDGERECKRIISRETLEFNGPGWTENDFRNIACATFAFAAKPVDFITPRLIVGNSDERLSLFPPLPEDGIGDGVIGATVVIKLLPLWRCNYLSLYAQQYEP